MRLLSQNIAQRANHDDGEVGKFWQARYRAVRLLDETAILACTVYVDLNPIRAAMAETMHVAPLMQRLGLSEETWCSVLKDFGRLFSVVAGQPHWIDEDRSSSRTSNDASPAYRYRARREARDLFSAAN